MDGCLKLTQALVLETNNLQGGGACADQLARTLGRVLERLRGQSHPLSSLAELIITHEGLSVPHQADLRHAAGRDIRFVAVPRGTGYYEAKNLGFEATTADVVAFGDADCWPEDAWLARLFAPFEALEATQVVAGRTCYRGDILGTAATTIDFMYFHGPHGPTRTRNFYANNVAFRREVFAAYRYLPIDAVYRGHCQMLGMRLHADGVAIHFERGARTTHRFPDTLGELARLRVLRGEDAVELTPHLARTYLPANLEQVGLLRLAPLATLAIRLGYSVRALGHQDMPPLGPVRTLACLGAIGGLSLLDAVGAARRSLARGSASPGADAQSLSYHQDVDQLGGQRAA